MKQSFAAVALECVFDLGVTVLYAVLVGLAIVAIVASDQGSVSLAKAAFYAGLLPASVTALIGVELVLRFASDGRSPRQPVGAKISSASKSRR